jgi:hypothetical protein
MVMILAGECSTATESIAEAAPNWNLVEVIVISYLGTHNRPFPNSLQ